MKYTLLVIFSVFFIPLSWGQEPDTLSFIKSKKMSEADLAKKREGTFFTGIPDISSDPVTGFGIGLRSNIYWNGTRVNPLFASPPTSPN